MKQGEKVHFIGIGGVSMSGIAIELARQGFVVSGSDVSNSAHNAYLEEIERFGQITLYPNHIKANITKDIKAVIVTSTISDQNPELIAAKELGIKILQRFEAINLIIQSYKNRIGIFGGAGKTTTTAITFCLFQAAGLLPSIFLGSVLNDLKSSVHLEVSKEYCIFETDESDASFKDMNMNSGIFVAMEGDHLEHKSYNGSYEKMKQFFAEFLQKLNKEDAKLSVNIDSVDTLSLAQKFFTNYKTFSINTKEATFFADNFKFTKGGMNFDIYKEQKLFMQNVFMPLIGKFNALNVLGGISQLSFFVSDDILKTAILNLRSFEGIDKRQAKVGSFSGFDIIDDYAHSPLKIKSILNGFSEYTNAMNYGLIPVCEIHKFSRLKNMYDEFLISFKEVKLIVFMDIYAVAGYTGDRIDIEDFMKDLKQQNPNLEILHFTNTNLHKELFNLMKREEFKNKPHNILLFFGAGLATKYAKQMQHLLESIA